MASVDKPEDNKGFAEKNNANFPILSDTSKDMSKAYDVLHTMGFAKRWTYYIGPDGKILKIDKDTNPATAGADLVKNLDELGVPAVGAD
jgi:peroxiredoxin Q/BCP